MRPSPLCLAACAAASFALMAVPDRGWAGERLSVAELVEVLVSDRPDEIKRGERLLAKDCADYVGALLETIRAAEENAKREAADRLGLLVSPWLRGMDASQRNQEFARIEAPRRPVERKPESEHAPAIRETLQRELEVLLARAAKDRPEVWDLHGGWPIDAFCKTLGEVATDETIDWAVEQLATVESPNAGAPVLRMVSEYLGLPPGFHIGLGCGLQTAEERARMLATRQQQFVEAKQRLVAQWAQVRAAGTEERVAFALGHWREYFARGRAAGAAGGYRRNRWLFEDMEALIRLGAPAVDALRRQQASETELESKGVWEAAIAAITGKENVALVKRLFAGTNAQPAIACEIVVSATSRAWLQELDRLQRRKYFDHGIASQAIAICHREKGLPALQRGFAWDPTNSRAEHLIKELQKRAKMGEGTQTARSR